MSDLKSIDIQMIFKTTFEKHWYSNDIQKHLINIDIQMTFTTFEKHWYSNVIQNNIWYSTLIFKTKIHYSLYSIWKMRIRVPSKWRPNILQACCFVDIKFKMYAHRQACDCFKYSFSQRASVHDADMLSWSQSMNPQGNVAHSSMLPTCVCFPACRIDTILNNSTIYLLLMCLIKL